MNLTLKSKRRKIKKLVENQEEKKLYPQVREKQVDIREGFLFDENECLLECNLFNQALRAGLSKLP